MFSCLEGRPVLSLWLLCLRCHIHWLFKFSGTRYYYDCHFVVFYYLKQPFFILLSSCGILSIINWNLPQRNHSDPLSCVGSWADQYFSRNPMFLSVDITWLLTFQIVIFLSPAVLFCYISFCVHSVVLESHAGLFQPI